MSFIHKTGLYTTPLSFVEGGHSYLTQFLHE